MVWALGPVKPHVKAAAEEIGERFDVKTIYGVAPRDRASDHPRGLALDFMVPYNAEGRAKGDAIASYTIANADRLGITYLIWYQRIWKPGVGWKDMEDRGSVTANHKDHPHLSFKPLSVYAPPNDERRNWPGPVDEAVEVAKDVADLLSAIENVGAFLTNTRNWVRVGMFVGGAALVVTGLVSAGMKPILREVI